MANDAINGVNAGIAAARGATTSVDGVPPAVLNTARQIALQSGGDPAAVSKFMTEQGYPEHAGEWCGDFVSAVVHASGGTPPPASPVAGAWANFGNPRQGGPQPGDVAIKRGYDTRTGSDYTHVTFVDSVNPDGTFVGLGGNQGGGQLNRSTFNTSEYDFRDPTKGPGTTSTKGLDLPGDAPNAGQYQPLINASAAKYGVNPTWLGRLLYQENLFRPTGTSSAGAQGIAQFMPATAARYGVNVNDPASSIDGAAHYLSDNLKRYGGNTGLATAAYNWGEQNVDSWLQGNKSVPKETLNYVQDITGHSINDWKGQGSGTTGAGPVDPSIIARGGVSPALGTTINTTGVAGVPATGGSMLPGFSTSQASDRFLQSTKDLAAAASGDQGQGGQQQPRPIQFGPAPGARNVSPLIGQSGQMMQQISGYSPYNLGTSLSSMGQPLHWGAGVVGQSPFANVGEQQQTQINPYGTTLSSMRQAQMMNDPYYASMMMGYGNG